MRAKFVRYQLEAQVYSARCFARNLSLGWYPFREEGRGQPTTRELHGSYWRASTSKIEADTAELSSSRVPVVPRVSGFLLSLAGKELNNGFIYTALMA